MAFSGQLLRHSLWSKLEFMRSQSMPPLQPNHESVTEVSQRKLKIRGIKSKSNCSVTLSMLNPQNGTKWNKKQVPFTRGCSCYELSRDGEELVIRKAQVIVESPIKPGGLAMEVFQKVISICDAFPEAAECMLISLFSLFFTNKERRYSQHGKKHFSCRVVSDESPSFTKYLQNSTPAKLTSNSCLVPQVMEYHSHHSYTYLHDISVHY
ncbi:hypothetical protein T459_00244 [Capsicum annuum]|uniref:Uncharacterized protein n=1 Tax=Capsicum annuum TaxID=4072 RepID=A0A2G3ADN5_CAPAN|nr:hypothetical protein T459_00244 [Capsicum annuum]